MVCVVSRSGRELQRYNMLGFRQVVGCIPYRLKNGGGELEVMLITSQKGEAMMFPKGGWELDESLEEAASRETFEEAGVHGLVEMELGQWNFTSKRYGTSYEGYMFPMLVKEELDVWPEMNVRSRIWVTPGEAKRICQHWWMNEALDRLVGRRLSLSDTPTQGTNSAMLEME